MDAWLEAGLEGYLVASNRTDESGRFFFYRVNAPVRMFRRNVLLIFGESVLRAIGLLGRLDERAVFEGSPCQPAGVTAVLQ